MDLNITLAGKRVIMSVYYGSDMGWSVDLVGNSSTNSCSRNPLLDMNDNKIVQLLGLAAAAWVVSLSQNML